MKWKQNHFSQNTFNAKLLYSDNNFFKNEKKRITI